jgi:glucokinase
MNDNSNVLGIDVGGQNIKVGWVDGGNISDFKRIPIKAENIVEEIIKLISSYKLTSDTIIGIGFPGFVRNGVIYTPPNLPTIHEFDLKKLLSEETPSNVYITNDANAVIYGESLYGAAKDCRIVAGFTLGTGIGGALVIDKTIYTGSRGFASEFGHTIIDANGPLCKCGKTGCLEAFIGAYAISNRYKTLSGEDTSLKEIFKKAKEGDEFAKQVVDEYGFYLAIGISNIIEVFDPDIVVLAGGVSKSGEQIIESLKVNDLLKRRFISGVEIKISKLGDMAGPIGAANWALSKHK